LFKIFAGAKRNKRAIPKMFRNKMEQTKVSKIFLKLKGLKRGILKLHRSKEEQTGVFHKYADRRKTN